MQCRCYNLRVVATHIGFVCEGNCLAFRECVRFCQKTEDGVNDGVDQAKTWDKGLKLRSKAVPDPQPQRTRQDHQEATRCLWQREGHEALRKPARFQADISQETEVLIRHQRDYGEDI
jgi:hypothetical protein